MLNEPLDNSCWDAALQDHLKGKMFRVGSMGETPIEEMVEGCKRMLACFREFGHDVPEVDVESYF